MRKQHKGYACANCQRIFVLLIILFFCFTSQIFSTAIMPDDSGSSENVKQFRLKFEDAQIQSSVYYDNPGMGDENREIKFKNAPANTANDNCITGILRLGNVNTNEFPYLYEKKSGLLHIDLNKNYDLGDDSSNTLTRQATSSESYPTFICELPITSNGRTIFEKFNINFYYSNLNVILVSGWGGEIELGGHSYKLTIKDNLDNIIETKNISGSADSFFLQPLDKEGLPVSPYYEYFQCNSFAHDVFVNNTSYRISYKFADEGKSPDLILSAEEIKKEFTEIKILNKDVDRLIFFGDSTAVIDDISDFVKIPAGNYHSVKLILRRAKTSSFAYSYITNTFNFTQNQTHVFSYGGKLRSVAEVSQNLDYLLMNYKLESDDGAKYDLYSGGGMIEPGFEIYKNDKLLASGKFQFG